MHRNRSSFSRSISATLSLATFLIVTSVVAGPGGLDLSWFTIDGGGGKSTGGNLEVTGTIAQPDASTAALTGGAFTLSGGFWSGAPLPLCPGDVNHTGIVNIDDLVLVITNWGACAPPCPPTCGADANHDCLVNIDDLVLVVTHWGACP